MANQLQELDVGDFRKIVSILVLCVASIFIWLTLLFTGRGGGQKYMFAPYCINNS